VYQCAATALTLASYVFRPGPIPKPGWGADGIAPEKGSGRWAAVAAQLGRGCRSGVAGGIPPIALAVEVPSRRHHRTGGGFLPSETAFRPDCGGLQQVLLKRPSGTRLRQRWWSRRWPAGCGVAYQAGRPGPPGSCAVGLTGCLSRPLTTARAMAGAVAADEQLSTAHRLRRWVGSTARRRRSAAGLEASVARAVGFWAPDLCCVLPFARRRTSGPPSSRLAAAPLARKSQRQVLVIVCAIGIPFSSGQLGGNGLSMRPHPCSLGISPGHEAEKRQTG